MSVRLGILLGNYDGSLSFEVLSNWTASSDFALLEQTTITHSSNNALHLIGNSSSPNAYNYSGLQPDVSSYSGGYRSNTLSSSNLIDLHFFAYADINSKWNGSLNGLDTSSGLSISADSVYQHYFKTYTTSNGYDFASENISFAFTGADSGELYVDDVLISDQTIELMPERNLQRLAKINIQTNQSLGGKESYTNFGEYKSWSIPLTNVQEIDAKTINRWQILARPLLLWLNTSDTAELYIVNITNNLSPFSQRNRPYHDEFQGQLQLTAKSNNLIF